MKIRDLKDIDFYSIVMTIGLSLIAVMMVTVILMAIL
jgi:hypothetical protein